MIYLIEYTYEKEHPDFPKANKSFHFVERDTEQQAIEASKTYIQALLTYRFKEENIPFEIKSVELVK